VLVSVVAAMARLISGKRDNPRPGSPRTVRGEHDETPCFRAFRPRVALRCSNVIRPILSCANALYPIGYASPPSTQPIRPNRIDRRRTDDPRLRDD
jgi:hypothetical protein